MSTSSDESIPLRWVRYDGIYYAALLVPPDEGPVDVPPNHSFVFFLDGESGAVVSNSDIERYDAQDDAKASHPAAVAGVALAAQLLEGREDSNPREPASSVSRNRNYLTEDDTDEAHSARAGTGAGNAMLMYDANDDVVNNNNDAHNRFRSRDKHGGDGVDASALDVLRREDATQMASEEQSRNERRRQEKERRRREKEERRRDRKTKKRLARAAVKEERQRSSSASPPRQTREAAHLSDEEKNDSVNSEEGEGEEEENAVSDGDSEASGHSSLAHQRHSRGRESSVKDGKNSSNTRSVHSGGEEGILAHRDDVHLSALEEEYRRGMEDDYAIRATSSARRARSGHAASASGGGGLFDAAASASALRQMSDADPVWASMVHHRYTIAWRASVAETTMLRMAERDVRQAVERQQSEAAAMLAYLDDAALGAPDDTNTSPNWATIHRRGDNRPNNDSDNTVDDAALARKRRNEAAAIAAARRCLRDAADVHRVIDTLLPDRSDGYDPLEDSLTQAAAFAPPHRYNHHHSSDLAGHFQDAYSIFVFSRLASVARPCELTRALAAKYREQRLHRDRVIQASQGLGKTGFYAAPRLMERWLRARELMVLAPPAENQPVKPTGYVARRYADSVAKVAEHARRRLDKSTAGGATGAKGGAATDWRNSSARHVNTSQQRYADTPNRRAIVTGTDTPFRGTDIATATQWLEHWEDSTHTRGGGSAGAGGGRAAYPAFYNFHTLHTAAAVDAGRPAASLAEQLLHESSFIRTTSAKTNSNNTMNDHPYMDNDTLQHDGDYHNANDNNGYHDGEHNNGHAHLGNGSGNDAPLMTPLHIDASLRHRLVLDPSEVQSAQRLDRMWHSTHHRHHSGVDASSALSSATVPNSLLPSASVAMLSRGSEVYSRSMATSENDTEHDSENEEHENRRGRSLSTGYDSAATSHADGCSNTSHSRHRHPRRRHRHSKQRLQHQSHRSSRAPSSSANHPPRRELDRSGRAETESGSWRSAAKRAILEQLTLYLRGLRGRPAVLSREMFETIARRLLDRAVRRESERVGLSLALQANNKAIPFTTQVRDGLKRSVDNYIQRHFIDAGAAAAAAAGEEQRVTEVPPLQHSGVRRGGKERSGLSGEQEEEECVGGSSGYSRAPAETPLPQPPLDVHRNTEDSPIYE